MRNLKQLSSKSQTILLNELLGSDESYFTIGQLLKYLPSEITYEGHRGDIFISSTEISYGNIETNWKFNLLKAFIVPVNGDLIDSIIECLKFMQDENIDLE